MIKYAGNIKIVSSLAVVLQAGRMDLRLLDGTKVNASVGYKNVKLLEMRKNRLIGLRKVV